MLKTATLAGAVLLSSLATAYAADPDPKNPALPTVWIAGDSTVHQTGKSPDKVGWGDILEPYFDTAKVNVVNRARGGRSSRTFITEGLWDSLLSGAKAGDVVLLQFGHNDSSPIVDADRCRGSIQRTGDETQETYNNVTKKNETVHTYGWYLRKMITDAKAKGMKVVVMSPVPRCPKGEAFQPTTEATGYQQFASEVAEKQGVPYVDLHAVIWKTYGKMKADEIKKTYFTPDDGTHTNAAGAKVNAESVVEGLKALKENPVSAYLL